MPIFEYVCRRCGRETTLYVLGSKSPAPRCEACGSRSLKRLISRTGIAGGGDADESALRTSPGDVLTRPERFGDAMRAFSAKTGMKLSGEQVDGAMHRLSEAKRKA